MFGVTLPTNMLIHVYSEKYMRNMRKLWTLLGYAAMPTLESSSEGNVLKRARPDAIPSIFWVTLC